MGRRSAAERPEPYISQIEVQRLLGDLSQRQLHRLLRDADDLGRPQIALPHHWIGQRRKFKASEVEAWVREQTARKKAEG
jgi:hypothetical protein